MGTALRALAAAALLARAAGFCDYGALPGYWDGEEWQLVGSECRLARLTGSLRSLPADDDVDILLVGDSFDRQTVEGVARSLRLRAADYTPAGEHEKIGRNLQLSTEHARVANLFIFGANNRGEYAEPANAGRARGMHFNTHDRVCRDYRRHAGAGQRDPYMVVINSALWDAMAWAMAHARKGWEEGDFNVPAGLSSRMRRKNIHQVFEPGPQGQPWRDAMARYESDLAELIAAVKRCLPHSRLFCWRTAPLPPTDSRTHHFWLKPPYVVAAMNAVGLHLARRMGLCVIDMERMIQGRGNDGHWVPDGSHPSDKALAEVMNVYLNILMQHRAQPAVADRFAELQRQANVQPGSIAAEAGALR